MLSTAPSRRLVLASQSAIRRAMLDAAGLRFDVRPADLDEDGIKGDDADPASIAQRLAVAKAVAVSAAEGDALVIGSDSVVAVGGRLFSKPRDRAEAAAHLRHFSGRAMTLSSAAALAQDGEGTWCTVQTATLHVRPLSDDYIAHYLDADWPAVGQSVGVFRLEGPGINLFERIDGDHFTILGMPLLPLLGALRDRGIAAP